MQKTQPSDKWSYVPFCEPEEALEYDFPSVMDWAIGFDWQFPECFKRSDTMKEQIARIHQEVDEALCADGAEVVVELLDVIHCAETALRMYIRETGMFEYELDSYKAAVIGKNNYRGYYDEVV